MGTRITGDLRWLKKIEDQESIARQLNYYIYHDISPGILHKFLSQLFELPNLAHSCKIKSTILHKILE